MAKFQIGFKESESEYKLVPIPEDLRGWGYGIELDGGFLSDLEDDKDGAFYSSSLENLANSIAGYFGDNCNPPEEIITTPIIDPDKSEFWNGYKGLSEDEKDNFREILRVYFMNHKFDESDQASIEDHREELSERKRNLIEKLRNK